MSYQQMAQVYDRLMKDAPYDHWVDFTNKMIERFLPDTQSIVDAGCGTGEVTHRLNEEGYHLTGVDLSEDMLSVAHQKNSSAKIQWLQQDITDLAGLKDVECVISYCDVMNYLPADKDVIRAFRSIYESLSPSGLFIFDVHSIDHIQNNMLGATFAEVYDDLSYIWFCDPGEFENRMVHDLTFFVQNGPNYERFDEQHIQQGYSPEQLSEWLMQTGFKIQLISSDFQMEFVDSGERIFFVCQKN
ncbi:Methyltransferase domain-containing protein [Halobacillus alkaliphilus]|uniref:Methyltransferase domain-containing protein n=1 Tax=Halobacillus alkaliphilus TaxID=396056 RepID=A0A1I2JGT4_9BACI|nr:class I SAM-dependent methyltransferase [Halobacillus alkaliphilus]SFF53200.1 Methyltransferase domain-containing protein [Halobacillus alkaliphilus]